ncbi:hypothetical protein P3X46_034669 [Hevea brasiliensis]|uniref:TF-B3 domain-containing protein n=1 Tax=Hevea brasiliensis TaxID=3981 RepID=A0ABQ9K948_HEVBR|nr:hypothetical protein P3X46_034669 [Hevea brasiliensis]
MVELINKVLSQTDVECRLSFPTASLWAIPIPQGQNAVEFQATSAGNNQENWNFRLSVRSSNIDDKYKKPELTGDWLRFVREKSLRKGNKIILTMEVEANGVRHYNIGAQMKLMGLGFQFHDGLFTKF